MVTGVVLKVNGIKELHRFLRKVQTKLPVEVDKGMFKYAQGVAVALRDAALQDPKRPITTNRTTAAFKIKANKLSKFRSNITMPHSLILLDGMSKHYVSLKRGRNITRWAKKNFRGHVITGRSRAGRGPRNGLLEYYYDAEGKMRRSALYVTPHRFIERTLQTERNKLPNELRKSLKKALSGA